PSADPTALEAAWWPVLTAWADTGVPWLDDAFALDVLLAVQRGLIAPTEETEAEFVSIRPRDVEGLSDVVLSVPPALSSEYPGALRIDGAGEERSAPVRRIVLRTAESAWVRAVVGGDAHYVVRASDGRVAQRLVADHTATDEDALAVDLSGGAASPGSFTVQSMEASARLVGWLARTHDLDVDAAVEISLGPHFPLAPWMAMVRCYEAQGSGCDTGLAGGVLASAWPVTELADDEDGAGEGRSLARDVPSVPYFYQYANARHPSASCQNTSIAMVLAWLGWSGTPDTITARFGKDLAQSPDGLAQVFNTLAAEAGLEARLTARTSGTLAGMNALLAEGKPVIVHGYYTGYGHVLVALGRSGNDYVVNDPAGRWAERFKGGYPYGWSGSVGRGIHYARGPFEAAIATSNGSSSLPLWYHELSGVDSSPSGEPTSQEPTSDETGEGPGPPGGELPPAGGTPGTSSTPFYDWADVAWIRPGDGDAVSNPVTLEARRWNGQTTEFLAGSWLLGSSNANPAVTTKEFSQLGLRSLTARNLSVWGTVLAESTITVDVTEQQASECAVVGEISCGQTVSGDNGSAEASYAIDGYPGVVGNWSGPELAWTWSGGAGEVTIRLVDPRPSELNHDILILEQSAGVCVATDQVDVAWNSLTFEPSPGAAYTFVVDAHEHTGPFQMQLECGG
ncbi:MAG: C39 family peptidase, partial [Deltaproteobacteria bacterium]|nr:C39 family peptidase [Deltaproteobacteria bacterium]